MFYKNWKRYTFLFVVFCLSSQTLWGWGSGHDYVNRGALTIMPDDIKNFLGKENQKKFIRWSHAPDSFASWVKEQNKYPITDKEVKYLQSFGAKNLYSLHSSRKPGQCANFILLIRAFMDKDPARSAFWMSTLMHTVADDVACNHTSQIHYSTYAFKPYNIKMGNGIGFDFANIAKTPEGKKAVKLLLNKYRSEIIAGTPNEVLEQILATDILAATYGTQRESKIMATYAPNATKKIRAAGTEAMAELGVYGIIKTMDMIVTAWQLAKQGKVPVLTAEIVKNATKTKHKYLAQAPLSDDSIYTGLLQKATNGVPNVGILLERSQLMMRSRLSFGGRLIMAAAMRTLKANKIPYCTIDLRDLDIPNSKTLDVKKIPLLMLCSGSFHVSNNAKNNLKKYFADGGRLLWVGGRDKGILGDLSRSLTKADPAILPVTKKYGQNNAKVINKISIKFLAPFNKLLGDKQYRFINNPDTKAGSQPPLCLLKVKPVNRQVKPIAELSVDNKTIVIAAELTDKKGNTRAIFIPEYLLAPFLLDATGNDMVNIADITLDRVGTPILLQAIRLLLKNK
jgi:hypothetical protein